MKIPALTLYVPDVVATAEFYKEIGFNTLEEKPDIVTFLTGSDNSHFIIGKIDNNHPISGRKNIQVVVESITDEYQKCLALGLDLFKIMYMSERGKSFSVLDPNGNEVEFTEDRKLASNL